MTCKDCHKRLYCIVACKEVNYTLNEMEVTLDEFLRQSPIVATPSATSLVASAEGRRALERKAE